MESTSNEYLVCFATKRGKNSAHRTHIFHRCVHLIAILGKSTIRQWAKTGMSFCKVQDDRSTMICVTLPLYHITFSHPCVTMLSVFWRRVYTLPFGHRECISWWSQRVYFVVTTENTFCGDHWECILWWSQRMHFVVTTESAFCGDHRESTLWWPQRVQFVVIIESAYCGDHGLHFVVITEHNLWWTQRVHFVVITECILWWSQRTHFVVITEYMLWWSQRVHFVVITECAFCGDHREHTFWRSQRAHFVMITERILWWSERVHFVVLTERAFCVDHKRVHFVVITERAFCSDHRECTLWWSQRVHFVVITESAPCGDHREWILWWSQRASNDEGSILFEGKKNKNQTKRKRTTPNLILHSPMYSENTEMLHTHTHARTHSQQKTNKTKKTPQELTPHCHCSNWTYSHRFYHDKEQTNAIIVMKRVTYFITSMK